MTTILCQDRLGTAARKTQNPGGVSSQGSSSSGDDAEQIHAFAFEGKASSGTTTVTALVNWDMRTGRNTTVAVQCSTESGLEALVLPPPHAAQARARGGGEVSVYVLTPAGRDGEGERGPAVQRAGIAINGADSDLLSTANCINIDHFSAFESGLVAPFLYAA
jgi:hypothetical protein